MARITVEDCLKAVDNRFELVMMAAKRARQLANGVEPQLDNSELPDKPTVLALREIAARRIDQDYIDAVDKADRARKEREALAWAAAAVVAGGDGMEGDDCTAAAGAVQATPGGPAMAGPSRVRAPRPGRGHAAARARGAALFPIPVPRIRLAG